ncbi:hypothetical protein K3152_09750 [Qipengyuania sp. 1NDH17]|uniref:DUF2867 domain-containing protein n=1 Tax=Qipengyuania polymorpha TaxID=2867234 RepID=A0ABS7J394_9SPHN|nr:hypothetical protein [Qipengyuania polymorpha]MBX7458529.1 hypothetical protein [Qipengyuania polymorpha]
MGLVGRVREGTRPPESLLLTAPGERAYVDRWDCDVAAGIGLAHLIEAFFTSKAFRAERLALAAIGRGGTDGEALLLAMGAAQNFAAWTQVERRENEILLEDFAGRTRCWLAVTPSADFTTLSFGTAIMARHGMHAAARSENLAFRALVPFHRPYARALLMSAAHKAVRLRQRAVSGG